MPSHEGRPIRAAAQHEGDRNGTPPRLGNVSTQADQVFWTAKEWSERTRVPYRSILAAVSKGELASVRPSGRNNGLILISDESWERWLEAIETKKRIAPRLIDLPGGRRLADLALS
jgi:hypothetical protein